MYGMVANGSQEYERLRMVALQIRLEASKMLALVQVNTVGEPERRQDAEFE